MHKKIKYFIVIISMIISTGCWEYDTPDGHKKLTYNPKEKILGKYVLDSASSSFYGIPKDSCFFILKSDSTAIIANMPNNIRTAENGFGEPADWEILKSAEKKWKVKTGVYPSKKSYVYIHMTRINEEDTLKVDVRHLQDIWVKPDSSIYFVKNLGKREYKGNYLVFNKDKTYTE